MTFHVNPKTGNSGICKAKNDRCPFGSIDEHFSTREEAQQSYEKKQEKFQHFLWKSKLPPTKGSYVIASYDPMSEEVPVKGLWGNPLATEFFEKLSEAEPGARLVIENGQVWEKADSISPDSWKFIQGSYDHYSKLEKHKTYDVGYLYMTIKSKGARLEQGGTAPTMSPEYLKDVFPDKEQLQEDAQEIQKTFNSSSPAPDEQAMNEYLDDYTSERWSGLSSQQWAIIRSRLDETLGSPKNIGSDAEPQWIWRS